MYHQSKLLEKSIEEISALPGIGQRTAMRLALHLLLRCSKEKARALPRALSEMIENIKTCRICHCFADEQECSICLSQDRDKETLCVVENIRDIIAVENTTFYKGFYHVLGGKISPMEGIDASSLNIESLVQRLRVSDFSEVIFALSNTLEGSTTMMYISKKIKENFKGKISTLAKGLPKGGELEYLDEATLGESILERISYEF